MYTVLCCISFLVNGAPRDVPVRAHASRNDAIPICAGYSVLTGPVTKLSLELGPAYRDTEFTDGTNERSLAGRGSLDFAWQFTHAISLTQNASIYWQSYNSTVSGTTALNAKLFGPLSAQLSYNVQYESEPPTGNVATDTTTTAPNNIGPRPWRKRV